MPRVQAWFSVAVLSLAMSLASGCNGEVVSATGPYVLGDGGIINGHKDGGGFTTPDGGGGHPMTCPSGQHLDGTTCVADEVTCASEFPCTGMQQCLGGRCIDRPGACATNDDCPTGNICDNGMCVATCGANPMCKLDSDCGPSSLCVQCTCVPISQCATPTADLSGALWNVNQDLHLDQALGSFGKIFAGVLKDLRDAVQGCPNGGFKCGLLSAFVVPLIPTWAQSLIVGLGNFADLIDNKDFLVTSEMTFTKNGKPSGYDGIDHWRWVQFSYQGMVVKERPENIPQIGKPVIIPFTASAVCGVLYVDKHKVEGVLSGLLEWIVDTVVSVSSNGQYHKLSDAIVNSVDCSAQGNLPAQAACLAIVNGLAAKIDQALNQWLLSYSLMTLQGTATVTDGHHLDNGKWTGTLGSLGGLFQNFQGEWSGSR